MTAPFTIRPAHEADLPALRLMFAESNMTTPSDEQMLSGTVAVDAGDNPVGFLHLLTVTDEVNPAGSGTYVYPVIVLESWRSHGVASALIDHGLLHNTELKLVACRESQDFYPKAGFEPLDWSQVAGLITRDCEQCPNLKTCNPQPFIKHA